MALNTLSFRIVYARSYLTLLAERAWNSYWAAICVVLLFIAAACLNLFVWAGAVAHWWLLGGFAAAFFYTAFAFGMAFRLPARAEVERRIEIASALAHRPIAALRDRLAAGLPDAAEKLWPKYIAAQESLIKKLRAHAFTSTVAAQDRHRTRYAALALLLIGLAVANTQIPDRLRQSVQPDFAAIYHPAPVALDAWIEPPAYTHEASVYLASTQTAMEVEKGRIEAPAGSVLKIRLSGYRRAPSIHYDGQALAAEKAGSRNYTLETKITHGGDLRIRQGLRTLGKWHVSVIADEAPAVSILLTDKTPRAALKIIYSLHDDYGVSKLRGTIEADPAIAKKFDEPAFSFDIPATANSENAQYVADLTSSIFAGMPVTLTLEAEDNMGHVTKSTPAKLVLPERKFTNPSAQRLIVERKRLAWYHDDIFAKSFAAQAMAAIAENPQIYRGDIVTFLALDIGIKRLSYDGSPEAVRTVRNMLWDIALKIEDNGLTAAARELSDALQKLSDKLQDKNASEADIQEIQQEVAQKLQKYFQALATEMQARAEQGQKPSQMSPELTKKFMEHMDMDKLLQQMKDLNKGTARERMQKSADFMKKMVDNLDPQKMQQMQEAQQKAMESLEDMQEITKRQQSLIDKTNHDKDATPEQAKEQQDIRSKLGEAMRKLAEGMPEIPENFGTADQEMKQSHESLKKGDGPGSLPAQKAALKALQEGTDKAVEQMAKGMQDMMLSFGGAGGGEEQNYGEGYDPLGRENNGTPAPGDIKLPEEAERRRVQEILKELRTRSNDYQRPKEERDYIDRLLKPY